MAEIQQQEVAEVSIDVERLLWMRKCWWWKVETYFAPRNSNSIDFLVCLCGTPNLSIISDRLVALVGKYAGNNREISLLQREHCCDLKSIKLVGDKLSDITRAADLRLFIVALTC